MKHRRNRFRTWMMGCLSSYLASAFVTSAFALDFSKHPADSATVNAIRAKGNIEPDDAFRLVAYIGKLPPKPNTAIYFDSKTGNIAAAMALGREIYKSRIRTYVTGEDSCLTICPITFLAGRDAQTGDGFRVKGSRARLGFHNFIPNLPERNYSSKEADETQMRAQKIVFELAVYFREVGAEPASLSYALKPDAYLMPNEEALSIGVHVEDAQSGELVRPRKEPRR